MGQSENIDIIHSLILLVFIGSSLVVHLRSNPGTTLRNISIWMVILFTIILAYSFRHDAKNVKNRIVGELFPSSAIKNNDGSISFRKAADGHYYIKSKINNSEILFMVDTGASDVVLSKKDAVKLGIDVSRLNYTKVYNTANGITYGAPVTINQIEVGDIFLTNVQASVNKAEMDKSLLGMSFLQRLSGYEVRGDILTIFSEN
ncbi:TIGR02281 family clan AA aspartic protease [Rickettsiales bacterium]|nr:TIGR02281 family clan AA aspartic protease [Rickettsiales bacterium]